MKIVLVFLIFSTVLSEITFLDDRAHCQLEMTASLNCMSTYSRIKSSIELTAKTAKEFFIKGDKPYSYISVGRTIKMLNLVKLENELDVFLSDNGSNSCKLVLRSQSVQQLFYDFNQNYCNLVDLTREFTYEKYRFSDCAFKYSFMSEAKELCKP